MDTYSMVGWVALVLFGLLSAFSAAAQEAINPINQTRMQRLENEGVPRAKAIDSLLERSDVLASALLLLATLATAGAAVSAAGLAFFVFRADLVAVSGLAVLLIAGLYFAQVAGRALALRDPKGTAAFMEGQVRLVEVVLTPVALLFATVADRLLGRSALKSVHASTGFNEEALYLLLNTDEEENGDASHEQAMIHRIVRLEDKAAREIMVPRIDVVGVEAGTSVPEIAALAEEMGYSRLPVYEESIDNVIGVLFVKDLLPVLRQGTTATALTARQLARPAHFIPESKHIDDLLHELRHNKVHFAVVVDEYGGTAGVVTMQDLLEEIVGEIRDEYDTEEPERIQVLNEREALCDAGVPIDEVNLALGLSFETDGYDTLGGFIYHRLGRVPERGDSFVENGLRLTVLSTEGRRIEQVRIERLPEAEAEAAGMEPVASWRRSNSPVRSH